jgi:hypothetical protein
VLERSWGAALGDTRSELGSALGDTPQFRAGEPGVELGSALGLSSVLENSVSSSGTLGAELGAVLGRLGAALGDSTRFQAQLRAGGLH